MTTIADLVDAFKREASVLGNFADDYPNATEDDIIASLADAFAEAQLDGFFGAVTYDPTTGVLTPDLSMAGAALIVIYAGMRLTRQQLRATKTSVTYKAGSVEYSTQTGAGALTEELRQLENRKRLILDQAIRAGRGIGTTFQIDNYYARQQAFYGGMFAWELVGLNFGLLAT